MKQSAIISYVGKVCTDCEALDALRKPSADYSAFDTFSRINHVNDKNKHTLPIVAP